MPRGIKQRHVNDCGVCVVAILAGVSVPYEAALEAVFPGKKPKQFWTSSKMIAAAFKRLGLKCDARARPLFGRSYKELTHDAVLLADRDPMTWTWHWLVWDSKAKRVIDPAKRAKKRFKVTSYLKIYRD